MSATAASGGQGGWDGCHTLLCLLLQEEGDEWGVGRPVVAWWAGQLGRLAQLAKGFFLVLLFCLLVIIYTFLFC